MNSAGENGIWAVRSQYVNNWYKKGTCLVPIQYINSLLKKDTEASPIQNMINLDKKYRISFHPVREQLAQVMYRRDSHPVYTSS